MVSDGGVDSAPLFFQPEPLVSDALPIRGGEVLLQCHERLVGAAERRRWPTASLRFCSSSARVDAISARWRKSSASAAPPASNSFPSCSSVLLEIPPAFIQAPFGFLQVSLRSGPGAFTLPDLSVQLIQRSATAPTPSCFHGQAKCQRLPQRLDSINIVANVRPYLGDAILPVAHGVSCLRPISSPPRSSMAVSGVKVSRKPRSRSHSRQRC